MEKKIFSGHFEIIIWHGIYIQNNLKAEANLNEQSYFQFILKKNKTKQLKTYVQTTLNLNTDFKTPNSGPFWGKLW